MPPAQEQTWSGSFSGQVEHRLFSHITMNWRGRPLSSHEVIVQTIAATTTRTGLRVHAALDTSSYDIGVRIADRQLAALPLTRHDWHGDWNYTLHPKTYQHINTAPDPFDQPSPDLAWLRHPALTGLPTQQWDALITTLLRLHDEQREASLDKRRGQRPRLTAPGTGRRPVLTLADRLLATTLHQRLALPQTAVAALFTVRPETINRHIRDIRQLTQQAGHTIQPSEHRLADLDGLYALATAERISSPSDAKTAC
jgi:Rhodopirellula transposase DDE domain